MKEKFIRLKKTLLVGMSLVLVMMAVVPANASSLMSIATLDVKDYWLPINKDVATASTCYGTNKYCNTAVAYAYVKIKNNDTSVTDTCTRYGWDAVSGEGRNGMCEATAKLRSATKANSTHKGKKYSTSSSWTEVRSASWKK